MSPDTGKFEHRVALVLGAVRGIGRGIGLALAEKGIRVALNYFDWEEHVQELEQAFSAYPDHYVLFRTDLRDPHQAQILVQATVLRYGRLDILINNIERGGWPVVHGPYVPEQWDLEMATTLRAKWWVCQAAMPHLKRSGNGVVINFSSIAGVVGRSGPASLVFNDGYAAANRAVSSFTETWARTGAPEVRVNEIMLGFFESRHGEGTRGWGLLTGDQKQAILDHTLLGRTGRIADAVRAAMFLIEEAPFMTGSVIRLDGGYVLGAQKVLPMPEGVL
jgi:3-oxoacyl-[acyl-carrier protein] reductase